MENRQLFWLTILWVVSCAVPSRCQYSWGDKIIDVKSFGNAKSREKWVDENLSNLRVEKGLREPEDSFWRRGIDGNGIGCSNWCVKETEGATIDPAKRVEVIWKMINGSRVTFTRETFDNWDKSESSREEDFLWEPVDLSLDRTSIFGDYDSKCEFYVELDCSTANKSDKTALGDAFSSRNKKRLLSMNRTEGYIVRDFNVDKSIDELQILVWGKLSQATVEIPMTSRGEIFTDARTTIPTLSLSRTSDGKGVRIDARNPSSGEWRLKLRGVENSKYGFTVVAATTNAMSAVSNVHNGPRFQTEMVPNPKLSTAQRRAHLRSGYVNDATQQPIKSNDQQKFSNGSPSSKQLSNDPEELDDSSSDDKIIFKKSARQVNIDGDAIDESQIDGRIVSDGLPIGRPFENVEGAENSDVDGSSLFGVRIGTGLRRPVVDVSPNAQFFAKPGVHDVVFTVTNTQPVGLRYFLSGESTAFPVDAVLPSSIMWIRSGETVQVAVRIRVPNVQDTSPSVVTLWVKVAENSEIVKKSTYVYVQDFNQLPPADYEKPCVDYTFNDNCNGKLDRNRCNKSLWSVDITVTDSHSGLRTVTSFPRGLESTSQFIAGTRNPVSFYYVSTCCYTTVDVKAIDLQGNVYTRTIDVTEWNNLTAGEIAAITLGALLLLLLIILIIILIIYCVRRRKSHDLSYSQRYGSRTPVSAERSNF